MTSPLRVILHPTVTVVGSPLFHEHPIHKIPPDGTDAEKIGAMAAKICYNSFGVDGRANIENQTEVIKQAHGSVLEHAQMVLLIEGISRACSLELNRHRHFGISQRSTRYTKEDDAAIVLNPYYASIYQRYGFSWNESASHWENSKTPSNFDFREVTLLTDHLQRTMGDFESYRDQVATLTELNPEKLKGKELRKWARGIARNKLPHDLETMGVWSGGFRAWRWFIEARTNKAAEGEIRLLANAVFNAIQPFAPTYFEDFKVDGTPQGIFSLTPEYHKV